VIGAIFGMNFDHIPGAHTPWGFGGAIGLMVLSAVIPWAIFRHKRWL
jgi:magnesium transporter